jgi:hypothetical protein
MSVLSYAGTTSPIGVRRPQRNDCADGFVEFPKSGNCGTNQLTAAVVLSVNFVSFGTIRKLVRQDSSR